MILKNISNKVCSQILLNKTNHLSPCHKRANSMLSWKVRDPFNDPNESGFENKLSLTTNPLPPISKPSEILVKVHATSVNPLDCRMVYGYGRRILDLMDMVLNNEPKVSNDRYPLTLGRDFSGEVIAAGPHTRYRPGDHIFGAIEPYRSGAHGQYVIANDCCVSEKPENLTHLEAASIPFVALTCYSALSTFGGLSKTNCTGKKILIVGGTGGVGSFARQLLDYWGADVRFTCSMEKLDPINEMTGIAYDHNDRTALEALRGSFDFILDCGAYDDAISSHQDRVDFWLQLLKPNNLGIYITLSPPFLSQTDKHGVVLGTTASILEAARDTVQSLRNLNSARWAFFMPNKSALNYITSLYSNEAISPKIHRTYGLKQMPKAFDLLQSGEAKGKIVVDMTNLSDNQESNE